MYTGDWIYLLFVYIKPLIFIALIIWFFVHTRNTKEKMNRLEAKIDALHGKLKNKE